MAAQGKKVGKSKTSWDDAVKKAAKEVDEQREYNVVLKVDVRAQSPGIVHEYIVELS